MEEQDILGPGEEDAKYALTNYINTITWKNDGSVIDIGCGNGKITKEVLLPFIPSTIKSTMGVDICEFQIMRSEHYNAAPKLKYDVLDITGDIPENLLGRFDHVFSFNCLHWIHNQRKVLENVRKLMAEKGNGLMMFHAANPFYTIFKTLGQTKKWGHILGNLNDSFPEYVEQEDPLSFYKNLLVEFFPSCSCQIFDRTWNFEDIATFKSKYSNYREGIEVSNPFEIPDELLEDFLNDVVKEAQKLDAIPLLKYKIFIVSFTK